MLGKALDIPFPPLSSLQLQTHLYQPSPSNSLQEFAANLDDDDDDDDKSGIMAASVRELPSKELDGVWDTCAPFFSSFFSCVCVRKGFHAESDLVLA